MLVVSEHKGSLPPRAVVAAYEDGRDIRADDWKRNAWSTLATDYSLVPSGEYPWARQLVRAVRTFDPLFVPVWVRRVYQLPTGGVKVMGYHGVGRYIVDPVTEPGEVISVCHKPRGRRGKYGDRPVTLTRVLDGQSVIDPETQRPGDYRKFIPFDSRVVASLRAMWWEAKESEKRHKKMGKALAHAELQRRREAIERTEKAADQAINDDRNMIQRALERGDLVDKPKERVAYGI